MLASKFYVFTTDRIIHNASRFPLSIHHLKLLDKTFRCNQSNKSNSNTEKYLNPNDTCERNVEDRLRCSQNAQVQQCQEKQNSLHKFEAVNIVSDYEKVRSRVSDLIGKITKLINEEKQTIVESLKKEVTVNKDDTCRWLKNISSSIDQKLEEVIQLDPCFGSQVRITVLRFKDHARNTFITLHCELAPSIKHIESTLGKIQAQISRTLQKAAIQALLCRCEDSPSNFKKCLSNNEIEAQKIVEKTLEEAETKLREVKKLRDYILKCHKNALEEETNHHSSEMKALSQYLDDCLVTLKKKKK